MYAVDFGGDLNSGLCTSLPFTFHFLGFDPAFQNVQIPFI